MGKTRPTTRTLPTGESVTHYPDGRQVLVQANTLAGALDADAEQQEAAAEALRASLVEAADSKREAQASGNSPVPSDKSVV